MRRCCNCRLARVLRPRKRQWGEKFASLRFWPEPVTYRKTESHQHAVALFARDVALRVKADVMCSLLAFPIMTQTQSFGDVGSVSGLPESGHGWPIL